MAREGDLVADLCCGSGTSLAVAKTLGCRVLGVDLSPEALLVTRARLNAADLELRLESSMEPVQLQGTCEPVAGVATLAGFPALHPKFPAAKDALDPLERWALGELEGDTFRELAACQRSFEHPALTQMLMAGQALTHPAVATVDAAGVYRVYGWKE